MAYYMENTEDELPYLKVPMHTLMILEPKAYGCAVEKVSFDVPCVDTHRPKPEEPGTLGES